MKAEPAGPFPPLHATFVKSEEFLLRENPEIGKYEHGRDLHLSHAQGVMLQEKVYSSLWSMVLTVKKKKKKIHRQ